MRQRFPAHFYEQIRIDVAISQLQHDLRKLFPSISTPEWEKADNDIANWFSGEQFELSKAHDFWNFSHCFARELKLKSLVSWATAENVSWERKSVPVNEITITWDFPGLELMGKAPYRARDVITKLNQPENIFQKNKLKDGSDDRSQRFPPRDHFPIILFDDVKGGVFNSYDPGLYILEGNRRTVKAILNNVDTIEAFVGKFKNPDDLWLENYWFPTGVLRDLIFLSIGYEKRADTDAFDLIRKFYQLLLRDFDNTRVDTIELSFKNFETDKKLMNDLLMEDLK